MEKIGLNLWIGQFSREIIIECEIAICDSSHFRK